MNTVDFTTWTLGRHTSAGQIERCPKCGRKGAITRFPETDHRDAFLLVVHTERQGELMRHVIDRCHISSTELAQLESEGAR